MWGVVGFETVLVGSSTVFGVSISQITVTEIQIPTKTKRHQQRYEARSLENITTRNHTNETIASPNYRVYLNLAN